MKFCPYCLSTNVPARRRYCDDLHRKRAQAQRSSAAGKLRYALSAARRRSIEREQHRGLWRQIAMGAGDESAHLAVVFRPKRKRRAFQP